jgi:hypothetical protein
MLLWCSTPSVIQPSLPCLPYRFLGNGQFGQLAFPRASIPQLQQPINSVFRDSDLMCGVTGSFQPTTLGPQRVFMSSTYGLQPGPLNASTMGAHPELVFGHGRVRAFSQPAYDQWPVTQHPLPLPTPTGGQLWSASSLNYGSDIAAGSFSQSLPLALSRRSSTDVHHMDVAPESSVQSHINRSRSLPQHQQRPAISSAAEDSLPNFEQARIGSSRSLADLTQLVDKASSLQAPLTGTHHRLATAQPTVQPSKPAQRVMKPAAGISPSAKTSASISLDQLLQHVDRQRQELELLDSSKNVAGKGSTRRSIPEHRRSNPYPDDHRRSSSSSASIPAQAQNSKHASKTSASPHPTNSSGCPSCKVTS